MKKLNSDKLLDIRETAESALAAKKIANYVSKDYR
jgi:hypothetical protein